MATADSSYNGWTNYETTVVKLWMDNDESSYLYWQERTAEAWQEAEHGGSHYTTDRSIRARILLAEQLQAEHEDTAPTVNGVYADLLNAALAEVDWHEIADSLLTDAELDGYEAR